MTAGASVPKACPQNCLAVGTVLAEMTLGWQRTENTTKIKGEHSEIFEVSLGSLNSSVVIKTNRDQDITETREYRDRDKAKIFRGRDRDKTKTIYIKGKS